MTYRETESRPTSDWAIEAVGVHKAFHGTPALADFALRVRPGTVCCLLGPNGAGKTTAVRILTTLLRPDGGLVRVAGCDVLADPRAARARIGLVSQDASVDEILTGRQNLLLFARLLGLDTTAARSRADELLDRFDLGAAASQAVAAYSGGMRRRLDLAVSLIGSPPVLFLDEPTTGLDPRGRLDVWHAIRSLVGSGTTVLLTTQHLQEADELADHIALIDAGRVVAEGTPDELKARIGPDRVETVVRKPTLDEVFLELTGYHAAGSAVPTDGGRR